MLHPWKSRYDINKRVITGSITVEAAFVMPIIILTIFALIYLTFYLHDVCRIQAIMDLTLHKAGITVKHEADIANGKIAYDNICKRGVFYILEGNSNTVENQIKAYMKKQLAKGLFLIKVENTKVNVSKFKIKVSVETKTNVTLPGISYLFDSNSNTVIKGEYPIHNPAETIRCTEVILDTVK